MITVFPSVHIFKYSSIVHFMYVWFVAHYKKIKTILGPRIYIIHYMYNEIHTIYRHHIWIYIVLFTIYIMKKKFTVIKYILYNSVKGYI